jgi:AcrR family transcriptional regulator
MTLGRFGQGARKLGKSDRTRARLMDAATLVFAQSGVEAASVNEIAQTAELANGTFYNHFKGKEEIVTTVAFNILSEIVDTLDEAMAGMTNAAERVSFGTRQFIELASIQPEWGLSLFRAVWSRPDLRRESSMHLRADLERGVGEGEFKVEVDDFLINLFASMNMMGVIARIRGNAGPETGARVAELQLRMLGVPNAQAKKISERKLKTLQFKSGASK